MGGRAGQEGLCPDVHCRHDLGEEILMLPPKVCGQQHAGSGTWSGRRFMAWPVLSGGLCGGRRRGGGLGKRGVGRGVDTRSPFGSEREREREG
jgi:hypothetical protein